MRSADLEMQRNHFLEIHTHTLEGKDVRKQD